MYNYNLITIVTKWLQEKFTGVAIKWLQNAVYYKMVTKYIIYYLNYYNMVTFWYNIVIMLAICSDIWYNEYNENRKETPPVWGPVPRGIVYHIYKADLLSPKVQ